MEQFEALFNHASIGIVVTNEKGLIINFNHYAEAQFGFTKAEMIGQTVDVLVPQNMQKAHFEHRQEFYKNPSPRKMGEGRDLFAIKKDGTLFPVEISLSNYSVLNDKYVIAFIIDITVRKKNDQMLKEQKEALEKITTEVKKLNVELEQKVEYRTQMLRETLSELEKSKEELSGTLEKEKELNELKSRFVTTASHEFRTPLSTILSSAYLLEQYNDAQDPEKRKKHIQRIKSAVGELKSILEDFLSLGKLEEGLVDLNIQWIPTEILSDDIHRIIDEMEILLKKGQLINLSYKVKQEVLIDKQSLKHILTNLLSNAAKFSPENSEIDVAVELIKNEFVISVKDRGMGISEEDQLHLFQRFFRAKNASGVQGTGLGLHIITKYLELMHGRIELVSALEKGSLFTVYIPQLISER
jgi:PAS domain S-box-containing protein